MTEAEKFYDEEVAPVLMELARKCEGANLSMVCVVEWTPGDVGKTMTVRAGAGIGLRQTYWAALANGNADLLIGQMVKHGKEHGHNSAFLHLIERA